MARFCQVGLVVAILVVFGAVTACKPPDNSPPPTLEQQYKPRLPSGATNIEDLGNDWIKLNLVIDGKECKFIYKRVSYWNNGPHGGLVEYEILTEMSK